MARCRNPVNRLLMLRKKGLSGPMFQNVGGGVCAKGMGNYFDIGGPGSGPRPVAGWTGPMLGCDYVNFLAVDTFTNIYDTNLTDHIPDLGGPWVATTPDNSTTSNIAARIRDNVARFLVTAKAAVIDCGESDVDIRVDWTPGAVGAKSGICFRAGANGHMLSMRIRDPSTNNFIDLIEWELGVVAGIGDVVTTFNFTLGNTYTLRVHAVGAEINCYVDDTLIMTRTHANFQTNTNHGIVCYGTDFSETFDNFMVERA